jgi:sigma-B regulation protein RsbU (phosphoserine phosphatase)
VAWLGLRHRCLPAVASHAVAAETPQATLVRSVAFTNDYIANVHGHENMFATLFFALLEPGSGQLHYLNAGHEAPFLRQRAGGEMERLGTTGPAVGLMAGMRCTVRSLSLQPGARLLLYTDGATEARGQSGTFGEEALARAMAAPAAGAQALVDGVCASLAAHVGGFEAHDDVTLFGLVRA